MMPLRPRFYLPARAKERESHRSRLSLFQIAMQFVGRKAKPVANELAVGTGDCRSVQSIYSLSGQIMRAITVGRANVKMEL
jgi:hypothetical protein